MGLPHRPMLLLLHPLLLPSLCPQTISIFRHCTLSAAFFATSRICHLLSTSTSDVRMRHFQLTKTRCLLRMRLSV